MLTTSESRVVGTLIVVILRAQHLPNKWRIGKRCPFCKVTFNGQDYRTRAVKRGVRNPEWDEEARFTVYDDGVEQLIHASSQASESSHPHLQDGKSNESNKRFLAVGGHSMAVACYADDSEEPELIGETFVDLAEVWTKGERDEWFALSNKGKFSGEVYLELTLFVNDRQGGLPLLPPLQRDVSPTSKNSPVWPMHAHTFAARPETANKGVLSLPGSRLNRGDLPVIDEDAMEGWDEANQDIGTEPNADFMCRDGGLGESADISNPDDLQLRDRSNKPEVLQFFNLMNRLKLVNKNRNYSQDDLQCYFAVFEIMGNSLETTKPKKLKKFMNRLVTVQHDRTAAKILKKIMAFTDSLPDALVVQNVERLGDYPVAGGGFSDVWKGQYQGKFVSLKVLREFEFHEPENRAMRKECYDEIMTWHRLSHNNVLSFVGVDMTLFKPRVALISPWMSNGHLLSYLKKNPSADRMKLILGIAYGLEYLHLTKPTVIHGDMRGRNVLVDDEGHAKLCDFGLVRIEDSMSRGTGTSFNGSGSLRWQAPELLCPHLFPNIPCKITTSSDVYAFACVCFEVFTEQMPFAQVRDPVVISQVGFLGEKPTIPDGFSKTNEHMWNIMDSCWSRNPEDRPSMCEVTLMMWRLFLSS